MYSTCWREAEKNEHALRLVTSVWPSGEEGRKTWSSERTDSNLRLWHCLMLQQIRSVCRKWKTVWGQELLYLDFLSPVFYLMSSTERSRCPFWQIVLWERSISKLRFFTAARSQFFFNFISFFIFISSLLYFSRYHLVPLSPLPPATTTLWSLLSWLTQSLRRWLSGHSDHGALSFLTGR